MPSGPLPEPAGLAPRLYARPAPLLLPCSVLGWEHDSQPGVALQVGGQRVEAFVHAWALVRQGDQLLLRCAALGEFDQEGETMVLLEIPGESPRHGSRIAVPRREIAHLLPA